MAEPIRPAGETPDDGAPTPSRTVDGAPVADARSAESPDEAASSRPVARRVDPEEADRAAAEHESAAAPRVEPAVAEPTAGEPAVAAGAEEPAPPAPHEPQPVLAPAADPGPPPRKRGNRVVATAWVLLAAGIFQVLFFAANALVALVFGGPSAVVPQVQSIAGTALAWLPVLLFFLLFELTVLLAGRAGRVAYVFMSLLVGAIVYVATVLLFSLLVRHTLGDANTLAQTFLNWEFILIGLVARETMLWTGLAIGSRGIRVRRRNREARQRYEQDLADARA